MELNNANISYKPGIYLHIPFCRHKCGYCDFYSITNLKLKKEFVEDLIREIQNRSPEWSELEFDTVYFGGGTPSLLSSTELAAIMDAVRSSYNLDSDSEITLEANPGTLDNARIVGMKDAGINRVSLGVQSFDDKELKQLDRIHGRHEVFDSFEKLRSHGFHNISIDLMAAQPNQNLAGLKNNLREAVQLSPEHISAYTLILEPNTPFAKLHEKGLLNILEDDEETEHYLTLMDFLSDAGFEMYEISNFAKDPRFYSRHNSKYWNWIPYLGFGPSAHSFDGKKRWSNQRDLMHYKKQVNSGSNQNYREDLLDLQGQMEEFAFLGLRQTRGIDKNRFQLLFNRNFDEIFLNFIRKFENSDWLFNNAEHLGLSKKGLPLCDEIAAYLTADMQ